MLRSFLRSILPNPFDMLLRKAARKGYKRFLLCWNRGLGDIPLGLFALVHRMRFIIPDAQITFLTRKDLAEGFSMIYSSEILTAEWKRGEPVDLCATLKSLGRSKDQWDVIIEKPDPTYWVRWQIGALTPKLFYSPTWDGCFQSSDIDPNKKYIGVHVETQTSYGYDKNWPAAHFQSLFDKIRKQYDREIILFGAASQSNTAFNDVVDLRGKTDLKQMLSVIKNNCSHLVVPDSGVLSLTYYLNVYFPIHIVSLWADPRQGVLKQNVPSPNKGLSHTPLVAPAGRLSELSVEQVLCALDLKEGC